MTQIEFPSNNVKKENKSEIGEFSVRSVKLIYDEMDKPR